MKRIRIRLWTFALVRRLADLPFSFATVRRVGLDDFPKLMSHLQNKLTNGLLVRFTYPSPR
jgi:hypothetical protein